MKEEKLDKSKYEQAAVDELWKDNEDDDSYLSPADLRLLRLERRYDRIQKSMCGILTPSDEEFTSNYKVHRIVFENILVDRENLPEGNDRSLSIPFDGKMRPVWAPNGYGKTFAFKILSFLHATPEEIWGNEEAESVSENFWYNFIKKCKEMVNLEESSTYDNSNKSDYSYQTPSQKFKQNMNFVSFDSTQKKLEEQLIPFFKMRIRLVGMTKDNLTSPNKGTKQVADISIEPNWDSLSFSISKKFWSKESLDSLFFEKFADEELKLLLKEQDNNSEHSIRKPIFLKSSFVFPSTQINFGDFFGEVVEDPSDIRGTMDDLNSYIADLLTETGEYYSDLIFNPGFKSTDVPLETLDPLIQLKGYYGMSMVEKEKLLLNLIELCGKYSSFGELNSSPLEVLLEGANYQPHLPILCTLLDIEMHGLNPGITLKEVLSLMLYSPKPSPTSWRTYNEIEKRWLDDSGNEPNPPTEDESIIEAIRNLSTCYFEIPSLINYSSESKLSNSQDVMKSMILSIRREYSNISKNNADYKYAMREQFNDPLDKYDSPPPSELFMNFLKIISQRLGGGQQGVLDSFFEELGIKSTHSYDLILVELEAYYSGRDQEITERIYSQIVAPPGSKVSVYKSWFVPDDLDERKDYVWFVQDLTEPIWENIATRILKFTEIYTNINETLDSGNSTSWSAMCRFHSLENCMQFSDPSSGFDIKEEHLSFGQRSVIVSEVCLGFSTFIDPKNGLLPYDQSSHFLPLADIQLNLIFDEPEIGRSEYWVNEVARRIIETSDYLEENKSIIVISHRESLLRCFKSDNTYYVMQPQESFFEEE